MWKRLGLVILAMITLVAAVVLYPVGGVIWHSSQVDRLALVNGDKRSEIPAQPGIGSSAVNEALAGVRQGRIKRILSLVTGSQCPATDLEFHTASGWVAARAYCPGGFFLDFIPRPGMSRP